MATLLDKIKSADLKKVLERKNYKYFSKSPYDLNIIGIRRSITAENNNEFRDYLVVEYKNDEMMDCKMIFPCTTTPGKTSLNNPGNPKGCAVLAPNQYRAAYKIGIHHASKSYQALVQSGNVKIYRDNDKDDIPELLPGTDYVGVFGINIHKSGNPESSLVNNWSAGCQVLKKKQDFDTLMALCWLQILKHPGEKGYESFTYTLIEEKDL